LVSCCRCQKLCRPWWWLLVTCEGPESLLNRFRFSCDPLGSYSAGRGAAIVCGEIATFHISFPLLKCHISFSFHNNRCVLQQQHVDSIDALLKRALSSTQMVGMCLTMTGHTWSSICHTLRGDPHPRWGYDVFNTVCSF
jgi:hypothetical protein